MGLSRTVSEIDGDFSRKLQNFPCTPLYFAHPVKGLPLELGIGAGGQKARMIWLPRKKLSISSAVWIQCTNVTDGQTDRRTPGDSKDRAYAYRRAVIQEAQLMLTNLRDAFIGQSRSPDIVPFHVLGICSFLLCNSNFVFKIDGLRMMVLRYSTSKMSCLEIGVRGHSRSLKVAPFDRLCDGFLLVFFSNSAPKARRFWNIRLQKMPWPWKPGYGFVKVIRSVTMR